MFSTTMSLSTTLALIVTALSVFADPDLVMPGVRRASSRDRAARTPPPLLPPNDRPILFPVEPLVNLPQPHGTPVNTRGTGVAPVLPLPVNIHELDIGSLGKLNAISNLTDFVKLFNVALPSPVTTPDFALSARISGSGDDVGETYEMANCKPELVTVPLDLPLEPNTMYFPTCIRLEQCGGCCFGPLLTCRPSVTKVVKVKVLKVNSASSGNGGRNRRQNPSTYHVVEAVKHTSCECGCRVREEDCNSALHTYFEGECSCVCKNRDEKDKCEQQNSTKYWDNLSCACYCRKPLNCGSGEFFSPVSCSCERLVARGGFLPADREVAWLPPTSRPRRNKPVRVPINPEV